MDRTNGLEHNGSPPGVLRAIPAGRNHQPSALLSRWLSIEPAADVLRLLPRPLPVAEP
jgi:hypothetical protein